MVNLKVQLVVVFLLVGLLPLITVEVLNFSTTHEEINQQLDIALKTAAHMKSQHVSSLINDFRIQIELSATHQDLSNEELQEIREINEGFYEVFVLDENGELLGSSEIQKRHQDFSSEPFFVNGKEKTYVSDVHFDYETGRNSLTVSTPFNEGILAARVDSGVLSEITTDREGWGLTGEAYIVNKDFLMITPSRFQEDEITILKQRVDSLNARNCFEEVEHNTEGEVTVFEDYRGVMVIGVYEKLPDLDWCLLAEFDEAEAFQGLKKIRLQSIVAVLILSFLIVLSALFYGENISRPIRELAYSVNEVSKGKLDIQLKKSHIQEVQILTDSLNRVLASMKLAILRNLNSDIAKVKKPKIKKAEKQRTNSTTQRVLQKSKVSKSIVDAAYKEKKEREAGKKLRGK